MDDSPERAYIAELFTSGGEPCEKCGDLNTVGISVDVGTDDSNIWERDFILCEAHFATFAHAVIFSRRGRIPGEWRDEP
jgi:hypothetical protein